MRNHPHFKPYLALVSVCFFWGTTYLTIRMALESFPPLVLVASRFVLSGGLMLAGAVLAGARLPKGRELAVTSLNGLLVLGVGNGCLTYAELWIPSGLAALFLTISPFWLVGIESAMPGGERLHLPAIAGMLVGCLGAALLVFPGAAGTGAGGGSNVVGGFLLLQVACASWSYGSIRQRWMETKVHPIVSGAVQQLAAGLAYVPAALLIPQPAIRWHVKGVAALLYLVVFGSIVGYSAYVYALDRLPVSLVSIYTYINPVVAVALGWLFYREPFGRRETLAMLVIFLGVAMVKRYSRRPAPRAASD